MRLSTLLFLVIVGLVVAFSIANWSVIVAPSPISLIFTTVQASLGLFMLGLILLVTVFFLGFLVYLQTSVLIESRRSARELEAQRQLADQAEASRFTDLRTFLEAKLDGVNEHVDRVERELKETVEGAGNTLASYIGELEDRLEHRDPGHENGSVP